ncbi:hypothetical protein PIB30_103357, partial [Stylosanthes scabra]|nr:hypothetical protein [Stylosanthes scabra]
MACCFFASSSALFTASEAIAASRVYVSLRALSRLLLVAGWFGSSGRLPFPESVA